MSAVDMLRAAITKKNMVHRDVAQRVGLTEVELSHVLAGRRPIKNSVALKLERVLGVSANEVIATQALDSLDAERQVLNGMWGKVELAVVGQNGMAV